jgi:hypothetical protein
MATLFEPAATSRTGARPIRVATALRRTFGVLNLVAAAAVIIALSVNISDRVVQGIFDPSHYFQYFTIQTCIINIVVLTMGGLFGLMRDVDARWYTVVRACVVSYAIVVGVVYNLLLAGLSVNDGYVASFEFPNLVQHVWIPIFIAVEWLLMPGRSRLRWSVLWIAAIYPLLWVAGSLVRGLAGDSWFPYFFLNPGEMGVGGVVAYVLAIAAFIIGLCALAVGVERVHSRIFVGVGLDRPRL